MPCPSTAQCTIQASHRDPAYTQTVTQQWLWDLSTGQTSTPVLLDEGAVILCHCLVPAEGFSHGLCLH